MGPLGEGVEGEGEREGEEEEEEEEEKEEEKGREEGVMPVSCSSPNEELRV